MYFFLNLVIFIILTNFYKILVKSEPDWSYDLISIDVFNNSPDIIYIDLQISRPARGIFTLSGVVDIKEDVTDDLLFSAILYYSLTGGSDFTKTPFFIPESNGTTSMNKYYKDYLMESFSKCVNNAPWTDDKFVMPLSKLRATLDNCLVSNENMPSKMRSGYYKLILKFTHQAEVTIEVLVKVEQNY